MDIYPFREEMALTNSTTNTTTSSSLTSEELLKNIQSLMEIKSDTESQFVVTVPPGIFSDTSKPPIIKLSKFLNPCNDKGELVGYLVAGIGFITGSRKVYKIAKKYMILAWEKSGIEKVNIGLPLCPTFFNISSIY